MNLYEKLIEKKNNGENLKIENLSSWELTQLYIDEEKSDKIIAELFNVKQSKITYLRRKYEVNHRNDKLSKLLQGKGEMEKNRNFENKNQNFIIENLDTISKAITHFIFRNGPIEDMHADPNNQLSDDDMKILNKFMVDRLAYVFTLLIEDRWIEFNSLVKLNQNFGHDWDEAKPDDGGTRRIIRKKIAEGKDIIEQIKKDYINNSEYYKTL